MNKILSAIFAFACGVATVNAQTSEVDFSVFGMGFGVLPSTNLNLTALAGDQFAGTVEGQNTRIESGFVNSILVGNVSIAVVVQAEAARAGSSVGVTVILPPNVETYAESLFYRRGGERSFRVAPLVRTGDTLSAAIPASATTIRGVEYYISASSTQGSIRFPSSGVEAIRVAIGSFASPLTFRSREYKMISVPVDLNDATIPAVLEDDYGPYNPSLWRVFRWESGQNIEFPGIGSYFTPGTAFWLITQSGNGFTIANGRSVSTLSSVTITLDTGWNQISNPFAFPVSLSDIVTHGYLSDLYYYDGTSPYVPNVAIMEPWEGYFIENRMSAPTTLEVSPIEATGLPPGPSAVLREVSAADFVLQLSVELEGTSLRDVHNYIGFRENALKGDDILDQREPPPMGQHIQLSSVEGRSYLSNYKPLPVEGEQWALHIMSSMPNRRAVVRLTEFGLLPEGFGVYLLDKDDFNAIPVQDGSFSLQIGEGRRTLKMIIGTKKYAEEHNEGIPLVPLAYALDQNYPNPFNPTTTIRYQLNKRSGVVLEVFNLLGQRVKTLVNSEQVTGTYTIQWRGENEGGTPVASGVYIYRLRAGDFVASRKMLMLR